MTMTMIVSPLLSCDHDPSPRVHAELQPPPAADQPLLLQPADLVPGEAHLRHLLGLLPLSRHLAGKHRGRFT